MTRHNSKGRRLLLGSALAISLLAAVHAASPEGLGGLVLHAVVGDRTEWSPTYSRMGFWRVRNGMTADEVLALVGEPIERYAVAHNAERRGWRWTRNPSETHYSVRVVLFDDGKVVQKISAFRLD